MNQTEINTVVGKSIGRLPRLADVSTRRGIRNLHSLMLSGLIGSALMGGSSRAPARSKRGDRHHFRYSSRGSVQASSRLAIQERWTRHPATYANTPVLGSDRWLGSAGLRCDALDRKQEQPCGGPALVLESLLSQDIAGNHQSLHLARALVDRRHPDVPIETGDVVFLAEAVAAVDLQ